jgi:dTDP-4-dehydrorhamnose reductase
MRILILGGNGMIGHKMYQIISKMYPDTWTTLRNDIDYYSYHSLFDRKKVLDKLDLSKFDELVLKLTLLLPDVIINASGITIRRGSESVISNTIIMNSALPHLLNEWVVKYNKRLIHFSTDCVFSGSKGNYLEDDFKDAYDIYGRTKGLGEVTDSNNTITLRGSMIGRELENKTELLEWYFSQTGKSITGYSNVIYAGITTIKMAEIVTILIEKFPNLAGVYNVSSSPVSKFELLNLFDKEFKISTGISPNDLVVSNKNLISNKLFSIINIPIPNWNNMVIELRDDCILNKRIYN